LLVGFELRNSNFSHFFDISAPDARKFLGRFFRSSLQNFHFASLEISKKSSESEFRNSQLSRTYHQLARISKRLSLKLAPFFAFLHDHEVKSQK